MNASLLPSFRPRSLLLLAAVAACLVRPVRAETDGSIHKTFDATPGGQLVVEVTGSSVQVEGTTGSLVVIEYTRIVSAGSADDEARYLQDHEVSVTQAGNTVSLVERSASGSNHSGGSLWQFLTGRDRGVSTRFKVSIKVPTQFNVDLRTSGGGIEVSGLTGRAMARTSGGSITIRNLTGDVDGRTSGGGITLQQVKGNVDLGTSGGSISSSDSTGRMALSTSGGSITIADHRGPVTARTSGGSIRAGLTSTPDGENRLTTSGGSITVTVPADSRLDLDASTSGGSVTADLPLTNTSTKERNRLVGTVNGGGSSLYLRTSGGSIRISAGPKNSTAATNR